MNEREIIRHSRVTGMSVFLDTIRYRTAHFHPEWELVWLLDAPMLITSDGCTLQAEKGALLLYPPDTPHSFRSPGSGTTILCLQLSPDALPEKQALTAGGGRIISDRLTPEQTGQIQAELTGILAQYLQVREHMALGCLGRTLLLFDTLFSALPVRRMAPEEQRINEKRSELLTALFSYVNENYMHKIRLTDFARGQGYSMSRLSHFVKDALNMSFQDYVTSVRVNAACKEMENSSKKLTQIALASGFSDYRYFNNAFRARFGMTPEQYRKSIRKPEDAVIHHSIHSIEQFYTDEQSLALLKALRESGCLPAEAEKS